MDFVAIDVETANPNLASICQIGVARFSDGQVVHQWSQLVDPEDEFDYFNISIHGIEPDDVRGKPRLPEVQDTLRSLMSGSVCVSHTSFDRASLGRAFDKYKLDPIETEWLDAARVVRRTWSEMAWRGYGLGKVCRHIGYEFKHHDALEDAKAVGHVLLAAIQHSGRDLDGWRERVKLPIDGNRINAFGQVTVARDGNPEGDLYGEVVVFTGSLLIPRHEAADIAARMGCQVAANVSHKTTLIVVGDQDLFRLAGHNKSTKHRKAEALIAEGQRIRIIGESDFNSLMNYSTSISPA